GEPAGELARSTLAFAIPDAGATDTGSSVAASVDFLIPDSAGTIQIDGKNFLKADPTVDSVKFGMFDHAFDAKGTLLADFIKEDSHRFHIRVVDPEAKGKGRVTAKYSTVKWSTAVLADQWPQAWDLKNQEITLLENPSVLGEFNSQPLMLIRSDLDVAGTTS